MPDRDFTITPKLLEAAELLEILCLIAIIVWGKGLWLYLGLAIIPLLIKITHDEFILNYISYSEAIKILGVDFTDPHLDVDMARIRRIEEINSYCVLNEEEKYKLLRRVEEAYRCWKQYTHWPLETESNLYEMRCKYRQLHRYNQAYCGFRTMHEGKCRLPGLREWIEAREYLKEIRNKQQSPTEK